MPNLPIFSQSRCVKEISQTPTTSNYSRISFNPSNSNTMLPFFFIPFTQNSNNNPTLPLQALSSPTQPIPSLDDFFESLDNAEEFMQFKNIFKGECITVDQIFDLTDNEFEQLGITKLDGVKVFRAAAQRYKK
ncbi:unnamed protein product [Rhizophagus irregularis]|nr:unnamed protein product [Rhizophagus irregularis]